jgi:hypothetical protein
VRGRESERERGREGERARGREGEQKLISFIKSNKCTNEKEH